MYFSALTSFYRSIFCWVGLKLGKARLGKIFSSSGKVDSCREIHYLNVSFFAEGQSSVGNQVQLVNFQVHGTFTKDRENAEDDTVQRVSGVGLVKEKEDVCYINIFLE